MITVTVVSVAAVKRLTSENKLPHLLLYGPPGTGKTSTILAVARQIYGGAIQNMTLELNASDDRGIGIVRQEIQDFASTRSVFRSVLQSSSNACLSCNMSTATEVTYADLYSNNHVDATTASLAAETHAPCSSQLSWHYCVCHHSNDNINNNNDILYTQAMLQACTVQAAMCPQWPMAWMHLGGHLSSLTCHAVSDRCAAISSSWSSWMSVMP